MWYIFLDCDFKGYRESMKTDEKKIYLVDSGLSFNLPFPLMLRPQRGIKLYITMDFSSRHSDSTPPFRVRTRSHFIDIFIKKEKTNAYEHVLM